MINLHGGCDGMGVPNGAIALQLNSDASVVSFKFDQNGDLVQPAEIDSNLYIVTLYDANNSRMNSVPMVWDCSSVPPGRSVDIGSMIPREVGL
jgi:hypothetical protein